MRLAPVSTTSSTGDDVVLSAALMHHPSRRGNLSAILARCAPLEVDVVADPDPHGVASPLRTARRAWASWRPGSTHHLVLQDDVVPVPGFAERVLHLIAQRPHDVISLSTNGDSPCNSYQVRSAAVAGQPYASLVPWEWVPTLGLVIPAALLHDLEDSLARVGPEERADDLAIAQFLRDKRRRVIVPVPHLIQHGAGDSLVGNADGGPRLATAIVDGLAPGLPDWSGLSAVGGSRIYGEEDDFLVTLSMRDSQCVVDLPKPGDGLWPRARRWRDWQSWRSRVGFFAITADSVLVGHDSAASTVGEPSEGEGVPSRLLAEFWACGFLLGLQVSSRRWALPFEPTSREHEPVALAALATWVDTGLCREDEEMLGVRQKQWLAEYCLTAVRAGALSSI